MPGAIRLAADAALRCGAGLVYVAAARESLPSVLGGRAEIMGLPADDAADLDASLELAEAVVVGPGLGTSAWAHALWSRALASQLPLVVDADGLNLLARTPSARGRWILTPHPGEAARLLGTTTEAVQRDRAAAVRAIATRFDAIAVLKGAGTLIASDPTAPIAVCDRGNPGMATGGMGDVLAGVLGSLLVQTRDLEASARAGVLLHALAGDAAAAEGGERGTIASDLMPHLRRWANPIS
jgi:NAD(P)H-hydrate epimerase